MSYINYSYDNLKTFCRDAFMKFGFTEDESLKITDVLLLSDLYGIESHGMQRLVRYHKGIENGLIKVEAKPETTTCALPAATAFSSTRTEHPLYAL